MRVGFDIHGVLDTFEIFREMLTRYVEDPNAEVHVISGLESRHLEKEIGHLIDLSKVDCFFSVTDYLVEKGANVTWIDGMPWADEEEWNQAKAAYCRLKQIDLLFDDSPIYAPYFNHINTIYCQIHNPHRKQFNTRGML